MQERILIGSYNQPGTAGIYVGDRQIKTSNPSYLFWNTPFMYAVTQEDNGLISAFKTDADYIVTAQTSTYGKDPCHIQMDRSKKYLFVTNYSSGNVAVFLLSQDGNILKLTNFLVHQGPSGVVPDRQEAPHPHSTQFSYDNKVAFICDLGTDYVYWYDFNSSNDYIKVDNTKAIRLLGYGPRHMALGTQKEAIMFVSCELNQTVVALSTSGSLKKLFEIKTSANPQTFLSEIKYFSTKDGQFIAVCSRGDNELIIYKYNGSALTQSTRKKVGNWPRHFNLNNSKTKFLVAAQRDNFVQEFQYENGSLNEIRKLPLPTPSYVEYL